jgi:lysophospholipase L1-like esterase
MFGAWVIVTLVVAASALYFHLQHKLHVETPREWYFEYLLALLCLILLSLRLTWVALPLLLLAMLEIFLGIGTALLFRGGLIHDSFMAPDEDLLAPMVWHPLLQAVPEPSSSGTGIFGDVRHNAKGIRGPERSAESLRDSIVVEVFGGSTVYDINSSNDEMWTNVLERTLGSGKYAVLNRGVGAYSTVENVIQTAFYQTPYGEAPTCAIYNVGWGDLSSVGSKNLDPGYRDYHTPFLVDGLRTRRLSGPWIFTSPVFFLVAKEIVLAVDTARPVEERAGTFSSDQPGREFEETYIRNIHTISAINRHRGIKTIWLAQPTNVRRETVSEPGASNRPSATASEVVQKLNAILSREASALGDEYIGSQVDRLDAADFFDIVHFTPSGSKKFAELIAPDIETMCRK